METITLKPADLSAPAAAPAPVPAKQSEITALLAKYEAGAATLSAADRKSFFYTHKAPEDVRLLNILCNKVDYLKGDERKAFFLAHPELEIRYSAGNFVKPATTA